MYRYLIYIYLSLISLRKQLASNLTGYPSWRRCHIDQADSDVFGGLLSCCFTSIAFIKFWTKLCSPPPTSLVSVLVFSSLCYPTLLPHCVAFPWKRGAVEQHGVGLKKLIYPLIRAYNLLPVVHWMQARYPEKLFQLCLKHWSKNSLSLVQNHN